MENSGKYFLSPFIRRHLCLPLYPPGGSSSAGAGSAVQVFGFSNLRSRAVHFRSQDPVSGNQVSETRRRRTVAPELFTGNQSFRNSSPEIRLKEPVVGDQSLRNSSPESRNTETPLFVLLKPSKGSICIYCAASGKNAFIKLYHGMMLGITVSLFRLTAGQRQHH